MYFYLIGIDYKTAPIEVRDIIYRDRQAITTVWENDPARQASVIITCNRIELYGLAEDTAEAAQKIKGFFKRYPDFSRFGYVRYGQAAVLRHALRVACGLESQLKGELQILAQVKTWSGRRIFHPELRRLWEEAIAVAQEIRYQTGLNEASTNIATIAFHDLKKRLNIQKSADIVVIGTGKIAELAAQYRPDFFELNFIAHKNYEKAKTLAKVSGGRAALFIGLPQLLSAADAVISATSSPHYILKKEHFPAVLKRRRNPLYLYDLALPRDIEPALRDMEGLVLLNLDDFNEAFNEHNLKNQQKIALASYLVEERLKNCTECADVKGY